MSAVTITQGTRSGKTSVSNRFIDDYMKDANDAQIKIYLYLLRAAGTSLPAGIADLADKFNHTEQDVMRALKYWDKLHVISLLYSEDKKLIGIRLEDLDAQPVNILSMPVSLPILQSNSQAMAATEACLSTSEIIPMRSASLTPERIEEVQEDQTTLPDEQNFKRTITADQLREFKNRKETSELLFIVEQYIGKPLSPTEMRSIFFMTDALHMSKDLIDYLIQYCVERGKKDFHYIEKVACNWTEEGITTAKEAAASIRRHDKKVYSIMKELGMKGDPAPKEIDFIRRWSDEYGFSQEMILEACGRAVLATDKNRFKYTEGILKSWYENHYHSLNDVRTKDTKPEASRKSASSNQFNSFQQNSYNYDQLLEQIRIN